MIAKQQHQALLTRAKKGIAALRERARLQAEYNSHLADAKERHKTEMADLAERYEGPINAASKLLGKTVAELHERATKARADLLDGATKFFLMAGARIGWRDLPEAVAIDPDKGEADVARSLYEDYGREDLVKVKLTLDKRALKEALVTEDFGDAGVELRSDGEQFYFSDDASPKDRVAIDE